MLPETLLRIPLSVIGQCSLVPTSQELAFHMRLPVWFYRITGEITRLFLVFSKNLLLFSFNKININVLSTFLPLYQVSIILHRCHFCKLETKIHHPIFFLWECFYMCFLTLRCKIQDKKHLFFQPGVRRTPPPPHPHLNLQHLCELHVPVMIVIGLE